MQVGLLEGVLGKFRSGKLVSGHEAGAAAERSRNTIPEYGNKFDSIKDYLIALLNTRRGSISHLPDHGLPDSTRVSMKDWLSVVDFGKKIEDTVRKYEPRLMNVRVKPLGRDARSIADFRLGFLLEARVVNEDARFRAYFRSSGSAVVEDAKD